VTPITVDDASMQVRSTRKGDAEDLPGAKKPLPDEEGDDWVNWNGDTFKRLESQLRRQNGVQIDLANNESFSRGQLHRGLHQPRTGVLASVRHYAAGSAKRAVQLLVGAADALGLDLQLMLTEIDQRSPGSSSSKDAETALCMVARAREAAEVLKSDGTDASRLQYGVLLAALAPPKAPPGDTRGMSSRARSALSLSDRNSAWDAAMARRAQFDAAAAQQRQPLVLGDIVLTKQSGESTGKIVELKDDGSCTLEYSAHGVSSRVEYVGI
jgi:hypothetical protein